MYIIIITYRQTQKMYMLPIDLPRRLQARGERERPGREPNQYKKSEQQEVSKKARFSPSACVQTQEIR